MNPNSKQSLMSFTLAAKAIIYDENRMKSLISMMGTPAGAIQAVQTVMGAIEQKKPVPPDIAPLLGMNVYVILVDCAKEVTSEDPDPEIVKKVVMHILSTMGQVYKKGA